MSEDAIRFRSDVRVDLVDTWGDDGRIANAAWVKAPGEPEDGPDAHRRVIRSMLMRRVRHTSPFEHSGMSVYVQAPAVVWWEWTRHRFQPQSREDHSFNLESGRYRVLAGQFYLPPDERPLREPEGFRPMRPIHETDAGLSAAVREMHEDCHRLAWRSYRQQIALGVAREVARLVLGPAIYYAGYVSGGVLTWLHFLALRTRDDPVKPASFPQWEIEQVARRCEELLKEFVPLTWEAWNEFGRSSP